MASPIHHMTVIRYYPGNRPWDSEQIDSPLWSKVESAIRRMDDDYFPIVQFNTTESEQDENIFNVMGGDGKWALFQIMGDWQYEQPGGGEGEVRLWKSDQGYYCREKNIITDIEKVLRITKVYYDTGSYDGLNAIE